jgi:iron complex outermembrane recepter protein
MSMRMLMIVAAATVVSATGVARAQALENGTSQAALGEAAVSTQPLPAAGGGAASGTQPSSESTSSSAAIPVVSESQAQPAAQTTTADSQLAEVVVTATKRKESTRTVPGGVSAITRDQLDEAGASSLGEYLSLAPGVNFDNGIPGYSVVTIRGISQDTIPGQAQTAVGMYYDDIPLTDPGAPLVVPDIDAFDASRIEVLRGPQGALYGSASLGGAINYIPEAPDPSRAEIYALGSGNLMKDSTWGYTGKLMLNAPLFGNSTAIRLVGYDIDQPGFIDNVGTKTPHANAAATRGGRAMFGWEMSSDSTLKLSALYQRTTVADQGYVNPSLPGLEKSTLVPEPSHNNFWLADAHYEWKNPFFSLILIGGYQEKESYLDYDGATALGIEKLGLQVPTLQFGHTRGYSGELRLVSRPGDAFNWLAGISYVNHQEVFNVDLDLQTLDSLDTFLDGVGLTLPPGIAATTKLFDEAATIRAPEEAVFFDASYRFFTDFKLSFGGRGYRNIVNSTVDAEGLLLLPAGKIQATGQDVQKADGFNPKASLSYDLTRGVMLYATYSKGYRLGGPNLAPITSLTTAKTFYDPDKVRNVEVGVKSRWWHGRLTAEVAAYDIGWDDIPLLVYDRLGLFKYVINAGNARSKGVEGAFALRPLNYITFHSAVSYGDGRLKNQFNPNNNLPAAEPGAHLPGAPNWTITNSLTGEWDWGRYNPSVTLIHRFVGGSPSNISYPSVTVGNYNLLDLRAGFKLGDFGFTAFGKNLTNTFARTAVNNDKPLTGKDLELAYISPPRSLGIEVSYQFGQ